MPSTPPVFLIPRGRTGGSLLATILGTHSQISFAYEIYPDRLVDDQGNAYSLAAMIHWLRSSQKDGTDAWIRAMEKNNFRTFTARAARGGVLPHHLLDFLLKFQAENPSIDFAHLSSRLDLIDQIIQHQMTLEGKSRWGAKMRVDPELLRLRHPNAIFLMMLRDGRDVLDSRLKVGNFNTTPEETAHDWINSLSEFEAFISQPNVSGRLIKYEDLVLYPETELQNICTSCDIPFEPHLVTYEQRDLSLLKNPHGHLSAKQIAKGLNPESIGRHKSGLTPAQLAAFQAIAEPTLVKYGYL